MTLDQIINDLRNDLRLEISNGYVSRRDYDQLMKVVARCRDMIDTLTQKIPDKKSNQEAIHDARVFNNTLSALLGDLVTNVPRTVEEQAIWLTKYWRGEL
jgi:hypothetical protein